MLAGTPSSSRLLQKQMALKRADQACVVGPNSQYLAKSRSAGDAELRFRSCRSES